MTDGILLQCVAGGLAAIGAVSLVWLVTGIVLALTNNVRAKIHTVIFPEDGQDPEKLVKAARWRTSLGVCCDTVIIVGGRTETKYSGISPPVIFCTAEELPEILSNTGSGKI